MANSFFARQFYSVTFTKDGEVHLSRHTSTLKAARSWAKWLAAQSYVTSVSVYRGQPGGELIPA